MAGTDEELEAIVDSAAAEYLELVRRGNPPSIDDFCARTPTVAVPLRRTLETLLVLEHAAAHVQAAEAPPQRLGRYRVVRTIGRGGMGLVCEAVDEELGRSVALKILHATRELDKKEVERFEREARAAARLTHRHIVPIYGSGTHEGAHYYVQQLVAGKSLSELLRELAPDAPRPDWLAPARVAELGWQAADALAYAHREGVLHRDVKPSNLLLDGDGQLWITDFGLAKTEGAEPLTGSSEVVGTPRYLAPEALAGWSDRRTDVYGLGVTLYELLARRPAFPGDDPRQLLRAVAEVAPPPLRRVDPAIPRDLETIVLTCLAKEPGGRYASADALAADLRRFLDGQPIEAQRPGWLRRASLFARRHRLAFAGVAGGLVVTIALLGGWIATLRASNERARRHLDTALAALDRFLTRFGNDGLALAPELQAMREGYLRDALELHRQMMEFDADDPGVRLETARSACRLAEILRMLGRNDEAAHEIAASVALLRELDAQGDPPADARRLLVCALRRSGEIAQERDDVGRADADLGEAIERGAALAAAAPAHDDVVLAAEVLIARSKLGYLKLNRGDRGAARALDEEAVRGAEALLASGRGDTETQRSLRGAEHGLALIEWREGKLADARRHLEKALEIGERLAGLPLADGFDRLYRNLAWFDLGGILTQGGAYGEGRALHDRAVADQEALAREYHAVPLFRGYLARFCMFLGNECAQSGERDEARRRLQQASQLEAVLAEEQPRSDERLISRIDIGVSLGSLAFNDFDHGRAEKAFADAVAWGDERPAALARSHPIALSHALALRNLAAARNALERYADAIGPAERAAAQCEAVLAADPTSSGARHELGAACVNLSAALFYAGRERDSERVAERIVRDFEPAGPASTDPPGWSAFAHSILGCAARQRGELDAAATHARRSVELRETPSRFRDEDGTANSVALADDLGELAYVELLRGHREEARRLVDRAIALARPIVAARLDWRRLHANFAAILVVSAEVLLEEDAVAAAGATLVEAHAHANSINTADELFRLARGFAACVDRLVESADGGAAPVDPLVHPWADAAVARLRDAAAAGFADVARLDGEPAFAALAEREDFKALRSELRARAPKAEAAGAAASGR